MTFNNFEVHRRFTPTFTIPFYGSTRTPSMRPYCTVERVSILVSEHERMDQKFSESNYFTRIVLIHHTSYLVVNTAATNDDNIDQLLHASTVELVGKESY